MATGKQKATQDKKQSPNLGFLNHRIVFASNGGWGIPMMQRSLSSVAPIDLIKYKKQIQTLNKYGVDLHTNGVHFFVDDSAFESVWNFPHKPLGYLKKFKMSLTPDFSLYSNWPIPLQIWNVYRNRWLGCFWQSKGIQAVPTMGWSNHTSFDFAFEGVQRGSVVAVSAIGLNRIGDGCAKQIFVDGFKEMIRRIDPCLVITSGPLPDGCAELANIKQYPTYWDDLRKFMGGRGKGG